MRIQLCCVLLGAACGMILTEGLTLLHELSDTAAMQMALHSFVEQTTSKSCSSLDGPMCLPLGIGPSGIARVQSLLSSVGWTVEDLKARMNEEEVVAALLAWWSDGPSGFTRAMRLAGAVELAAQATERLKS